MLWLIYNPFPSVGFTTGRSKAVVLVLVGSLCGLVEACCGTFSCFSLFIVLLLYLAGPV